ncbi:MAG: DUF2786 domain-containing protein [Burkholderiales bacterium]|nr:DUF2786 domain-containing protein [Burkholderiales bacterium]
MNKQKILDKIKKCFALSKSANANEAAIALKQAYALAKQYGIEYPELINEISNSDLIKVCRTTDRIDWKLIGLIKHTFNVSAVTSGLNKEVRFFGSNNDIVIAGYIFEVLSRLLKKSRTEFLKNHTNNRMKRDTKTRRAELFSMAWIKAIEEEVLKFKPTSSLSSVEHSSAVAEYQKSFYEGIELTAARINSKKHSYKDADYSAYYKGQEEGSKVTINNGINGNSQLLLK